MESFLVAPLLGHVRAAGMIQACSSPASNLPPTAERDPSVVLALGTLRALFDAAERLLGDPFLGLHLAESLPRGTFGLIELICEAAPNIGAALHELARRHALLNDLIAITVHERGDRVVVEHHVPASPLGVGRHANEFFVANLIFQSRRFTGRPSSPTRHSSPTQRRPTPPSSRARSARATLRFGGGVNGLELDAADVYAPMITADPPLAKVLDAYAQGLLVARPPSKSFLDQVRAVVRARLPAGPPLLDDVAAALRLSPRTLQRRLDQEGAPLRDVIEAVREELARDLLLDRTRTIEAVGLELGYADARAFLRAFKRWTGTTPTRFRAG